jgi:chemotaxis response regulator CheB
MKAVRVMIAHPNEAVVEKLRSVIEADPRVAVVSTAQLGEDTVRKASITWPTVVVMDLSFPDMNAGRVIKQLSQARLPLAVLICSQNAVKGTAQLDQAVQAGAYDFILLPKNLEEIENIGRQILTTIHVTGFSKTKQIPQVDPSVEVKIEASVEAHARLNCVVLDFQPVYAQQVAWLLCRVHPQSEPAVLAVVRQPAPAATTWLQEIGPKLHTQAEPFYEDAYLQSGRILILDEGPKGDMDRVMGLDTRNRVVLKPKMPETRRGVNGPSPVPLYRSLAEHYGGSLAVVMFGKPSPDSAEALVAAKDHGALTLAFESSGDLLSDLAKRFSDKQVPDDIVTLEQCDRFMNAVLITRA